MGIGDKYYLRTNLRKAVYISEPGDSECSVAESVTRENRYPQTFMVLRSMLMTPAQRDAKLAKLRRDAERRRRWKNEMAADGYGRGWS